MRFAVVLTLAMSAGSAMACDHEVIQLTEWSATKINDRSYSLEVEIEHAGARAFRMVEGSIEFYDALDRPLGHFLLPQDLALEPGETAMQVWPDVRNVSGSPALASADPEDVVSSVCVAAVVYDDGEVERFD